MILNSFFKKRFSSTSFLISTILLTCLLTDCFINNSFLFIPLLLTIIFTSLATKWLIPKLNNLKIRQIIRQEGPEVHYKKAGTATMGGLIVIPIALLSGNLLNPFSKYNEQIIAISLITLAFMAIGALDDWLSLTKKTNSGLSPKKKLILQGFASMIFVTWGILQGWINEIINLPLGVQINTGILILPLMIFVFLAESNSTNLADGLDGLASGCGALVFSGLALELSFRGSNENLMLASFCIGMAGSWLGFLTQNKNPAKIFMGDTGSLAMGGALTGIAIISNTLWALFIMGGVFVLESLSVIIQVLVFKITKKYKGAGKRIFLMAPLHHHYEMAGINENIIVSWFWITTGILVVFSLLLSQAY